MFRKICALMLALCLLAGICVERSPARAEEYTVYVVSNTLPVYSKVSTSSSVLGTMAFGEKLTCLATNSSWAAVRNDSGEIGYCKISGLSTTNPNKYSTKIYINSANVPVYRKPDTGASVMMTLEKNSSYTAVAKTSDGNWARLKNGKYYGYVQMKYISTSPEEEDAPLNQTVYASANTLKVYNRASTSGTSLGTMSYGESMTLLSTSGEWAQVRNDSGETGYCKISGLTTTNPNKYSTKIYINSANVPVYRRPDTGGSVMMTLEKNSSYTAVAKTSDGNWARLKNGKYYGYVQMKYISTSPEEEDAPLNQTVYVSANTLKVYNRASTSGTSLGTMSYGESMTLLSTSGEWAQVRNDSGETGYCKISGLTTTNPNKYSQTIYINANNVPVYRRPDTGASVLMTLQKGSSYTAVAITGDGQWLRLKSGSSYGYVQSKYASDTIEEELPEGTKAYVASTTLKVYAQADSGSTLLGTLSFGESLTLITVYDGWAQVRNASDAIGYCTFASLTNVDPNQYDQTLYAVRDGVILYSKAMTSANRVRTLATNESVQAVARSEDGQWVRIASNGSYAYGLSEDFSLEKVPEDDSQIHEISPITVYVSSTNLTFYKSNSTQAAVLGTLSFGESLTCNGTGSGWARLINSSGTVGYCQTDGLSTTNPNYSGISLYVQKEGTPVYANASTSSSVLMNLSLNAKVTAVATSSDQSWMRLYNGTQYGYVQAKYLASTPIEDTVESSTLENLVELAMSLQGIPYVYAAQSPSQGFDCSGFTYYVYKNAAGITLKRTAKTQGYDDTYAKIESKSDLKVGDLVFFNTVTSDDDLCDHVGIYLGNNQFIHASSGAGKVTISSLGTSDTSYYYRTYSWARRILS